MTRMTRPDCAVMCNTHIYYWYEVSMLKVLETRYDYFCISWKPKVFLGFRSSWSPFELRICACTLHAVRGSIDYGHLSTQKKVPVVHFMGLLLSPNSTTRASQEI